MSIKTRAKIYSVCEEANLACLAENGAHNRLKISCMSETNQPKNPF